MFNRLIAKDFKRHEDLDMAFEPGLTLLIGPNYTGKSSVLQAILYAFGGPSAVPGGSDVVTRKGAKQADVTVHFTVNGDTYRLRRHGSRVNLDKNDEPVAKSASAVGEYLENLTGLTKERFLQLKHGAQKETEALLTLGVTKLHSIIEEISGAQTVSEVIGRASSAMAEAKGGLAVLPEGDVEAASDNEKALRETLLGLSEEIKRLKVEAGNREFEWKTCKKAYTEAQNANAENQQKLTLWGTLQSDRRKWLDALDSATKTLDEIPDLTEKLAEAKQAWDDAVTAAAELESESRRLATLQRSADVLAGRVGTTTTLISKCEEGLENAPEYVEPLIQQAAFNQSNADFQGAKQELSKICEALKDGICPTCMRPFEGYNLDELEQQRRDLEAHVVKFGKVNIEEKEKLDKIQTNNKLRRELEDRIASHKETLQSQKEDLATAVEELHALKDLLEDEATLNTYKAQVITTKQDYDSLYKQQMTRASAQRSLEACDEPLRRIQHDLDTLGDLPDPIDLEPLKADEERTFAIYQEHYGQVQAKDGEYTGRYNEWMAAKERHKRAIELEDKRISLEKRAAGIEDLIKYLRKNRDRFLSTIWDGIMGYASNFASTCTDGTIERLSRNVNGTFSYVEGGETHPIKAASGAQRSIMGLGVQLALAQMLPSPLSVLLLDEPTADLDPERSLAMASLLSTESSQVIMVSHRELDGAVAGQVYDMSEVA